MVDHVKDQEQKSEWVTHHKILVEGKQLFQIARRACHYTTLEKFWLLMENETFWATDVRFSNDWLEREEGMRLIQENYSDWEPDNFYMICFCRNGDLLSQWREYGKTGVSMEMDFSRDMSFTILENKKKDNVTDGASLYALPVNVLYSDAGKKLLYSDSIIDADSGISLEKVIEEYEKLRDASNDIPITSGLNSLCSYIKHHAFAEEKESRLIFHFSKISGNESKYVWYRDDEGKKIPFIKIKYGDAAETKADCECTYVDMGSDIDDGFRSRLKAAIKGKFPQIQSFNEIDGGDIYISAGSKDQEKVFEFIDKKVSGSDFNEIKIWCDGHWPVRSVMVGPHPEQKLVKESIEHYCKNHYWLQNVRVTASETPYRMKRI